MIALLKAGFLLFVLLYVLPLAIATLLYRLDGTGPGWEETLELIRIHTRQFAKRQLTWFRHLPLLTPLQGGSPGLLEHICKIWNEFDWSEIDTSA